MLAEERFNKIIAIVEERGSVTVAELTTMLETSESTIRRDLTTLDKQKKIVKVHGGATAIGQEYMSKDASVSERMELNREEKMQIGMYAATLIQKEDFVYIDAGTSTECLVDCITEKDAVYVTNGISHARKLLYKGCTVYLLGGQLKRDTEALIGAEALSNLKKYHFTKGFFGTNGAHIDIGMTTPDLNEAAVKTHAMEQCRACYVLADSSKLGKISSVKFAEWDDVKVITTNVTQELYKQNESIVEVNKEWFTQ